MNAKYSGSAENEYLFCLIPHINFPQELFRSGGEVELEGESKNIIDCTQEVKAALYLRLNLANKNIQMSYHGLHRSAFMYKANCSS